MPSLRRAPGLSDGKYFTRLTTVTSNETRQRSMSLLEGQNVPMVLSAACEGYVLEFR